MVHLGDGLVQGLAGEKKKCNSVKKMAMKHFVKNVGHSAKLYTTVPGSLSKVFNFNTIVNPIPKAENLSQVILQCLVNLFLFLVSSSCPSA